jgi:hypothetical protein
MRAPTRDEIAPYVEKGLVREVRHSELPITLFNYTAKCQYDRLWDDVTVQCRGLILDQDDNIIARPFPKFHGIHEHESLPDEPFHVYDKLDGSLFIATCVYWGRDDEWELITATRGSFDGVQANLGRSILMRDADTDCIHADLTYCFELLSPDNRIVVDYGDRQELVLLDVLRNDTGKSVGRDAALDIAFGMGVNAVEEVELDSLDDIPERDNAEGYVIHFQGESDLRVKAKHPSYVRLHKLYSGINERTSWEYLSEGKDVDELIDAVPDEFHQWVRETARSLRFGFDRIRTVCAEDYENRPDVFSRKETADYFLSCAYPSVLFRLLDGYNPDKMIWDLVRPKGATPYSDRTAA